jgi:DNA-directed RNA polymerase subunit beta
MPDNIFSPAGPGGVFGPPRDDEDAPAPAPPPPASPPPVVAPARQPPGRALADGAAAREAIYRRALEAVGKIPPVENKLYALRFTEPHYADPGTFTKADRKKAVLTGGTLGRRLRATLELVDKTTGETADRRTVTLARVPHMTDDGVLVAGGVEYSLGSQPRLRPGIFTRRRENGEVESHFNVAKGLGHRLVLDPESGVFRLAIGQAKLPFLPILQALGATDDELQEAWGPEVLAANRKVKGTDAVDKLAQRLLRPQPGRPALPALERRAQALAGLAAMTLDPEVTARTLGTPYAQTGKDAYLRATKRVLAVSRGAEEPDDRDHLAFMKLYGPEDLIAERIERSARLLQPLLWRATSKKNLAPFGAGFLDRAVWSAVRSSGLGQAMEEVGPAEILGQLTRVTRLGEGGISGIDSIPDESRMTQPSHYGFLDPLLTPESLSAGVDLRAAARLRKDDDGRVWAPFRDPQTGAETWVSAQDVADKTIAFPGELESQKPFVAAIVKGRLETVPRDQVDLVAPEVEEGFNPLTNLVPFKSAAKGQRVVMGARMLSQALSLVEPEAPWVQPGVPGPGAESFHERYGRQMGAVFAADRPGVVTAVSPEAVTVRYADGRTEAHELFHWHPLNRKSPLHNTAAVAPGDRVAPGQLLARSNFTDAKGVAAPGKNLFVAYLPYQGESVEDAVVVSESAARKLTSHHMTQHALEWDDKTKQGKRAYVSLFPTRFDRRQLAGLGDDGVIAPGTAVQPGDPLVLAARERERTYGQVARGRGPSTADAALVWEEDTPGVVTDAVRTDKGVTVVVRSEAPLQIADKLSGLHGNKGVVSKILPDSEMPRTRDGRPADVLLNSLGLVSRVNSSQIYEALLGKVAEKTGQPYKVQDFKDVPDLAAFVAEELKKHGVAETEDLVDPTNGLTIPNVTVGVPHILKLHHTSASKEKARSTASYTAEDQPSRGGPLGGKKVAMMHLWALLSHGSVGALKDALLYRGQKSADLWADYLAGKAVKEPKVPLVNRKFFALLQAAGVNPVRQGPRVQLMAMTDKDVDRLAEGRELQNAETVSWGENLKPIPGGLFDEKLFGGVQGEGRWAQIRLAEPVLNPVMEPAAQKLLGLTAKQLDDVLAGRAPLPGAPGAPTGPQAVQEALARLDVAKEVRLARQEIASGGATRRDAAIKKLRLLKGAEATGVHPRDWVITKVPVLPPLFRPVSVMGGSGLPLVADINLLYRDLFEANKNLKDLAGRVDDVAAEREAVRAAVKAVVGLGEPVSAKNRERRVKGALEAVLGSSPKFSYLQGRLLGKPVDLVGRSVITPNADLDMDEVGIPESAAWEVYRPFVARRLARKGMTPLEALKQVQAQSPLAKKALYEEAQERPVIIDRAPVLHRYGMIAQWPRLVPGHTMQMNPFTLKGLGADFDGDQQFDLVYVKISKELVDKWGSSGIEYMDHLEDWSMPYGATTTIPTRQGDRIALVHLADFPHGAWVKETQGQWGKIDWFSVPEGVEVLAYDEASRRLRWAQVSVWSKHYGCPTQLVDLESGRQIFTDDDPRAVVGVVPGTLELVRNTPAAAAKNGLLVPRMQRLPAPATTKSALSLSAWSSPSWRSGPGAKDRDGPGTNLGTTRRLRDAVPLTADVGYFFGVMAGDGWASCVGDDPKGVCLAATTEAIVDKISQVMAAFFVDGVGPPRADYTGVTSYGRSRRYLWNTVELGRVVVDLLGRGADNKHLPAWFLSTSEDFRLGLFAGLMDTDGSISLSRAKVRAAAGKVQLLASFSTNSLRLAQEVVLLAASLRIRSRVTASKTPAGKPCWMVSFAGVDTKAWGGPHMVHPGKLKWLGEGQVFPDSPAAARGDLVPIPTSLAEAVRKSFRNVNKATAGIYGTAAEAVKTGVISRQSAKRLPEAMTSDLALMHRDWDRWWAVVQNDDVTWERVVGYQDTGIKVDGYDLTVPGSETFTSASGVVLSNTMNWHVPFSDEAVRDAVEKMLPSKNLLAANNFRAHQTPINEFKGGLFLATRPPGAKAKARPERVFRSAADVIAAFWRGELAHDDPVVIAGG